MWFKNLCIYRLASEWTVTPEALSEAPENHRFQPANSSDAMSAGCVDPSPPESDLAYHLNGQYLLTLRHESKLLPASVINHFTRARAQEVEEQQSYKPGRRQMREIKEQVKDTLLPKAFSQYRDTRVWIDSRNQWLVIDAGSVGRADEVIGALAKVIDPLPLKSLHTEQSRSLLKT